MSEMLWKTFLLTEKEIIFHKAFSVLQITLFYNGKNKKFLHFLFFSSNCKSLRGKMGGPIIPLFSGPSQLYSEIQLCAFS